MRAQCYAGFTDPQSVAAHIRRLSPCSPSAPASHGHIRTWCFEGRLWSACCIVRLCNARTSNCDYVAQLSLHPMMVPVQHLNGYIWPSPVIFGCSHSCSSRAAFNVILNCYEAGELSCSRASYLNGVPLLPACCMSENACALTPNRTDLPPAPYSGASDLLLRF